jgi:hypothetical protein
MRARASASGVVRQMYSPGWLSVEETLAHMLVE